MNLWEIYKSFYQRSYRRSWDLEAKENTDLIHGWLKDMFFCNYESRETQIKNGLTITELLREREIAGCERVYFSSRLKKALISGNWTLEVPYAVLHRWRSAEYELIGEVYVLTSQSRKSQFKVGATTMPLEKRVARYQSKYWESVNVEGSVLCCDPFEIEKKFMDSRKFTRVTGNGYEESIEWYFGDPTEGISFIELLVSKRHRIKSTDKIPMT